jgi:anti-sigma factor (TIGR02949 family)
VTERSIGCSDAIRRLWDYLDETLSAEDQTLVEGHLAFCRRCCGELEFAKELRALLSSNAIDEIPIDVKERLDRFMEEL